MLEGKPLCYLIHKINKTGKKKHLRNRILINFKIYFPVNSQWYHLEYTFSQPIIIA